MSTFRKEAGPHGEGFAFVRVRRARRLHWRLAVLGTMMLAPVVSATAETLNDSAERYRPVMVEDIAQAFAGAQKLQERIQAKDLEGARKAWIDARVGWERAEVFTSGFVPDLDEKIDSWPNAQTGFHAVEAKIFGAGRLDVQAETSALIFYLGDLNLKVQEIPLTPQGLLNGTARLAYEVGENKADGGESRFSGTSLDDMRNNAFGIAQAYRTIFAAALKEKDPELAATVDDELKELKAALDIASLKDLDQDQIRTVSERLVISLQTAGDKVGLRKPTLEELTQ